VEGKSYMFNFLKTFIYLMNLKDCPWFADFRKLAQKKFPF
jgi:hypothetical protein